MPERTPPFVIAVAGPSGSGKSTLARLLADRVPNAKYEPLERQEFFTTTLEPGQSYADRDAHTEGMMWLCVCVCVFVCPTAHVY